MEQNQLDILSRFDESRNAYNLASGLMKKGNNEEAEALLRKALTLYPRQVLMDEASDIDPTVRESFELLFSNIRTRLEQIERAKMAARQPAVPPGSISSLQDIVERNMGMNRAPVVFGGTDLAAQSGDAPSAAAPQRPAATLPTIEEVLRMDDEPVPEAAEQPAAAEEEPQPQQEYKPKYTYEPPEDDTAEAAQPEQPVEAAEAPQPEPVDEPEPQPAPVAEAEPAPAPAGQQPEATAAEPAPVDIPEAAAPSEPQPAPAVQPEVASEPETEPQHLETGEGLEKVEDEEVTDDKKKKRKGFKMKLPGLLKRKPKPEKDTAEEQAAKEEEILDATPPAPASEEAVAEEAAVPEVAAAADTDDASAQDEQAEQPAAEEPSKGRKLRRKRPATKEKPAAAKPVKAKKPTKAKSADLGGTAAGLIFLILSLASLFAAYAGLRPAMRLQRAFAYAGRMQPAPAKQALPEKIMDSLLGAAASPAPVQSFEFVVEHDAQGRALVAAAAAAGVSKLSGEGKAAEAVALSKWAVSAGLSGPALDENRYRALYNESVRSLKAGDTEQANKYFDELSTLLADENFPDPGSHYLCVTRSVKLAKVLFIMLAEKRLDKGDAEGAYWSLYRVRALGGGDGDKFGDLAARASGALSNMARGASAADAERWSRMARSIAQ